MTGPATPDPLVLRAPRLLDGTGTPAVTDAALVVEGGRIAYAGPAAGLPEGAGRLPSLEFPGATLLPGLVDAHVHLVASGDPDLAAGLPKTEAERTLAAVVNARRNLDRGITLVRDLGAPRAEAVLVGRAVEDGTLPGPRVVATIACFAAKPTVLWTVSISQVPVSSAGKVLMSEPLVGSQRGGLRPC